MESKVCIDCGRTFEGTEIVCPLCKCKTNGL